AMERQAVAELVAEDVRHKRRRRERARQDLRRQRGGHHPRLVRVRRARSSSSTWTSGSSPSRTGRVRAPRRRRTTTSESDAPGGGPRGHVGRAAGGVGEAAAVRYIVPMTIGTLFTIGYEGRTQEEYLALLGEAGVTLLVDVRRNPISRKKGFSRST